MCSKYSQASKNCNGRPTPVCSQHNQASKNCNGSPAVNSKNSEAGKNRNGSSLCVVCIVKVIITAMVVPCV